MLMTRASQDRLFRVFRSDTGGHFPAWGWADMETSLRLFHQKCRRWGHFATFCQFIYSEWPLKEHFCRALFHRKCTQKALARHKTGHIFGASHRHPRSKHLRLAASPLIAIHPIPHLPVSPVKHENVTTIRLKVLRAHSWLNNVFRCLCARPVSANMLLQAGFHCNHGYVTGWHSAPLRLRESGGPGTVTANVNTSLFPLQVWWHRLLAFEVWPSQLSPRSSCFVLRGRQQHIVKTVSPSGQKAPSVVFIWFTGAQETFFFFLLLLYWLMLIIYKMVKVRLQHPFIKQPPTEILAHKKKKESSRGGGGRAAAEVALCNDFNPNLCFLGEQKQQL